MLSVNDALEQILANFAPLPAANVDLAQALGRVLAADVRSDINLPPFANSSMDGYAVQAADIAQATRETPVRLHVSMDIPAGAAPTGTLQAGEAARIMTGAPLPAGADAVIPVEQTDHYGTWQPGADTALAASVQMYGSVQIGDNVRQSGEDIATDQVVLQQGTVLRPQDIGVLAALGSPQIGVVRQPRVAIISTGDELLDVGEPLTPGKIRDANRYTLAALVTQYGGIALPLPIARDTLEDVRGVFTTALDLQPDIIMSSAGVSVGAFDVVRTVLDELGQVDLWRVNLRPGKPLAFGKLRGVPFFGLPGNPVSAMVTFDLFVRPALYHLLHRPTNLPTVTVRVAEDVKSDGRRSYLRVKLERGDDGSYLARLTGTQSSGALMSMVLADALLIIPEGVTSVQAGTLLQARVMRTED